MKVLENKHQGGFSCERPQKIRDGVPCRSAPVGSLRMDSERTICRGVLGVGWAGKAVRKQDRAEGQVACSAGACSPQLAP